MHLDPKEAALRGRIGALALHSRYDPKETTKPARKAFLDRFLREVDPYMALPEPERERRARMARKLYFARLALKSARTRGKKKATAATAAEEVRDASATPSA